MAGGSSKKLTELCDAVKNHEESDEAVKNQLLGQLTQWDQTAGFKLQKSNKESIGLLLELFLLKDKSVSKQVFWSFLIQKQGTNFTFYTF